MKKFLPALMALVLAPLLGACPANNTDREQARQTEQMVAEANRRIGPPNITNFTERRFAKQIMELRDEEVTTYSYFVDFNGRLHFLCESVGFGLPYSVQYVNPERRISTVSDTGTIPQAEPNGLFMPDGLSATWVLCADGEGGVHPVYSEPSLVVSPFPLNASSNLRDPG